MDVRALSAFTHPRSVRTSIDVTRDSDSDGMIGFDFRAERSVYTSAAGGSADSAPPPAAADAFAEIGVDIGVAVSARCDGYEAETVCRGAGSGDANSNGMVGDEEPPTPRVIGDDFHAEHSVFTSAVGGGTDGAPPAAAADAIAIIGFDIGAGYDGCEAETTCWGAESGGVEISRKREVVDAQRHKLF